MPLPRVLVVLLLAASPALASESGVHAGRLAHELDRLARTGRVLYVAAHPDDENTRLLAHLANGRHLHARYLSMTRGGGGQNLVGHEQGDLLDVIRTEELLSARSIDAASQRFARTKDFGYSKSAEETLAIWGHEEALADVVRAIRAFQPDVMVSRFDEKPPNHGHHTASAILAREAFSAAADPARFPGQVAEGLAPWQALRLVHNVSPWRQQPVPEGSIELDVGGYDPRLGYSHGELAALSRSRHVSQGFGVAGERGPLIERFAPVAGARATKDLMEGVDVTWMRMGEAARPLVEALDEARALLQRDAPEAALPALARAHRALDALPDEPRVRDARRDLDRIVALAAGLFARATAPRPFGVPGGTVKVDLELTLRQPAALILRRVTFPGGAAAADASGPLKAHEKRVIPMEITIAQDAAVTAPPWLAEPSLPGRHVVGDPALIGIPDTPPALEVLVDLELEGRPVRLHVPVVHAWTDPARGERLRAFVIVPPATITPEREAFLLAGDEPARVDLRVRAGRDALAGRVVLDLPPGWRATPESRAIDLATAGGETTVSFEVAAPAGAGPAEARPAVVVDGRRWSWREETIDHDHVPLQVVLRPASLRLMPVTLDVPPGLYGFIPGSGDSTAADLAHAGLRIQEIGPEELRSGDLSRYDGILVGIRAFNTRDDLRAAHGRLMAFVEQGGTLVVQYVTNNRLAPLTSPLGPHPLEVGRDRVTDETAEMTPIVADHPVLMRPHRLVAADFEGWVQERGIYFASSWDERWQPIFRMADPGEETLLGSTLVTRHGKGRAVYTGLVFFRQLPAGVPGAYRLMLNLLAPEGAVPGDG